MSIDINRIKPDRETDLRNAVKTLINLYSDKAHFIDELIQNAEDSGYDRNTNTSQKVSLGFLLREKDLLIWNSGRPFDEKDAYSICAIGQSTKDLTEIGTFGIGFKAVYIFTDLPEIYSGDAHFYIQNYLDPKEIHEIPDEIIPYLEKKYTVFRLPFKQSLENQRIEQLKHKLRKIDQRTLLFFKRLETIDWQEGDAKGRYCRKDHHISHNPAVREIELQHHLLPRNGKSDQIDEKCEEHSAEISYYENWLIFSKSVLPKTENILSLLQEAGSEEKSENIKKSSDKPQLLDIAFKLNSETKNIEKVNNSVLFAYLPTEKETHLSFLIQARFQTTPARDNVSQESPWNQWLIDEIATFIPDVLVWLKKEQKITPSFFEVLPIATDKIPDLYKPIVETLSCQLKTGEFIPTETATFSNPSKVFYPESEKLRILLSRQDLSEIAGIPEACWLHPDIRNTELSRRPFEVIREAGVKVINASQVISWCLSKGMDWFKTKDNEWLSQFYSYLSKQKSEYSRIRTAPIIRLEDGNHVSIDKTPVFFAPQDPEKAKNLIPFFSEIPIICRSVMEGPDTSEIRAFLQTLGVKPFEPMEVINTIILPKYSTSEKPTISQNITHIHYFTDAISQISSNEKTQLINRLKNVPCLYAKSNDNSEVQLKKPDEIYISSPLLKRYFENAKDIWFIDDCYKELNSEGKTISSFFSQIGCHSNPKILKEELAVNRRLELQNNQWAAVYDPDASDFLLEGLDGFLNEKIDSDRCHTLWEILQNFKESNIWKPYSYRWNEDRKTKIIRNFHHTEPYNSRSLLLLKGKRWILDEEGIFHLPSELYSLTKEKRLLPGNSLPYLDPSLDSPGQWLQIQLGIHTEIQVNDVIRFLISISGKNIEQERIFPIYQYLSKQSKSYFYQIQYYPIIFIPETARIWWKINDVFWKDESRFFGDSRGYLEKIYASFDLHGFFIDLGVKEQAGLDDYCQAIMDIASTKQPEGIDKSLVSTISALYRKLDADLSIEKSNSPLGKDLHISSSWKKLYDGKYWLGTKNGEKCFFTLNELVINDNDHIANLFKSDLPFFWKPKGIQFTRELGISKCGDAKLFFKPIGKESEICIWTTRLQKNLYYITQFLLSPQLTKNDVSTQTKIKRFEEILKNLSVNLVEDAQSIYSLKELEKVDSEAISSYFDEQTKKVWIIQKAKESDYPELIGDAFQKYFNIKQLREFIKEILNSSDDGDLQKNIKKWQKDGLQLESEFEEQKSYEKEPEYSETRDDVGIRQNQKTEVEDPPPPQLKEPSVSSDGNARKESDTTLLQSEIEQSQETTLNKEILDNSIPTQESEEIDNKPIKNENTNYEDKSRIFPQKMAVGDMQSHPSHISKSDEKKRIPSSPTTTITTSQDLEKEDWAPECAPEEAALNDVESFTPVQLNIKKSGEASRNQTSDRKEVDDSEDIEKLSHKSKVDIGNWGERYVLFQWLKDEFSKEFPEKEEIETENGYRIVNQGITIAEVFWLNKYRNGSEGYDIKIVKGDKEDYIEVKSTKTEAKDWIIMTRKEWKVAQEKGDHFHIYRIYNAGSKNTVRRKKITNPVKLWQNGDLDAYATHLKV